MDDEIAESEEAGGGAGWIMTFADLMSLLMCFFVLLLSFSEMDVLKLIAQGFSNREIGEQLHLSEHTVSKYTSSILEKLYVANRTQAALYALRSGIASLDPE